MTTQQRESTDKLIGVPETLMITLYARYVESQRSPGILYDAKAVEIAERIEYDFEKYVKGWASQLACVIRAREYDHIVQNFIEAHPNAVIVNLGAGLCTRFSRIDKLLRSLLSRTYATDLPSKTETSHHSPRM
jgi:O-methyltransferase involved in polyketide biosynthesis